jgi:hypothetical protein
MPEPAVVAVAAAIGIGVALLVGSHPAGSAASIS